MTGFAAADLFAALRAMELPAGDYAVFGSGPLAVRGLIERVGDLDVITRGRAWDAVANLGETVVRGGDRTVDLGNGLTFGRSWDYLDVDVDELIDEAEWIDGLPFVALDAVIAYKRAADRPKDREHLRLMAAAGLLG